MVTLFKVEILKSKKKYKNYKLSSTLLKTCDTLVINATISTSTTLSTT